MASTLITCIILRSVLFGLPGSFFLKKYMSQMYKIIKRTGIKFTKTGKKAHKKSPGFTGAFFMCFKKY